MMRCMSVLYNVCCEALNGMLYDAILIPYLTWYMISYVFDVLNEMSYAVFLYDTSQNMFIIKYRNMALTVRLSCFFTYMYIQRYTFHDQHLVRYRSTRSDNYRPTAVPLCYAKRIETAKQ